MNRLKRSMVVSMAMIATASTVVTVNAEAIKPQVSLIKTLTSNATPEYAIRLNGVDNDIVALEITLEIENIDDVKGIQGSLKDCYMTYITNRERNQVTLYIVSNDKEVPILMNDTIGTIIMSKTDSISIKNEMYLKLIKLGYETDYIEGTTIVVDRDQDEVIPPSQDEDNKEEETPSKPEDGEQEGTVPPSQDGSGNQDNDSNHTNNSGGGSSLSGNSSSSNRPSSSRPPSSNENVNDSDASNESEKDNIDSGESDNKVELNMSFSDLNGHWAKESITKMASQGIIKGYEDGSFKPNASITRGEFATLIARAFNLKSNESTTAFSDVADGKWYTEAINVLYEKGIVSGRGNGKFGVNDSITNEEISTIIYRTINTLDMKINVSSKETAAFTDESSISTYAKEAVLRLKEMGIINGNTDGSYGPKTTSTRAQVATILDRVLSNRIS